MREVGVYGRDAPSMWLMRFCWNRKRAGGPRPDAGRGPIAGVLAIPRKVISIGSLALIPAFLNTACRSVFVALREIHLSFLALLVEVTIMTSASLYLLLSGYGAIALM